MGQPLSMDLRKRLLAAIDVGMSCRAAAARFGVVSIGVQTGPLRAPLLPILASSSKRVTRSTVLK